VSRSIVEEHGGSLSLRSVPGEFCEFTVELPVPDEDAAGDGADRRDR
jgi:signal transduction histidine kinase